MVPRLRVGLVVLLAMETEGLPVGVAAVVLEPTELSVGVPATLAVLETTGVPERLIGLPERVVLILPQGLGERVIGLVEGATE